MGIFDHRHYWRPKTNVNKVMSSENPALASSVLIIEDCLCGAVRTIEVTPGKAPEIRITQPPRENAQVVASPHTAVT